MSNVSKPWTSDEVRFLYESRQQHKSYQLIAAELGRTEDSARSKYRDTDFTKLGLVNLEVSANKFVEYSKFTDKQYNILERKFQSGKSQTDAIVEVIERAVEKLPKVTKPTLLSAKKQKKGYGEDVGLLLSDLHIGHEHSLEETNGLSEYNIQTFKQRLDNLETAMTDIVQLHSMMYKLPKLHIMCLGDVVAGMNAAGNWSPLYIACPIVDQMFDGFHAMRKLIHSWLGMFEEIHFYGIVGNHGRSAPLGIQKDYDNWDYVCYKFLETTFKDNERVKFHVPKSWWMMEQIRGHNFLMIHGDNLKGGGLPIKSLANFEQKMGMLLKEHPDYTVAGHFHNASEMASNSGKLIINGSFIGSDVYSLKTCHAGSPPEQKLFGINDRHGITWTYNINLDIPRGD